METLSSWQERKRKLEGERDDLVRRLEVVERDIVKAQAGYGAIYNKDSPALTLPTEITCLIFREAHSAMEVTRKGDQIVAHLTEVAISHVCRQWRSAAIGLPILWSSFYYHGPSATHATLNRFEIYLERSKLNPLELWLDFRQAVRDTGLHFAVLNTALMVVSRWRLVSIFSDGDSPQYTSRTSTRALVGLKLKELQAPCLEHLGLYPNLTFETDEDLAVIDSIGPHVFTEGAPTLKSVRLDASAPNTYLPPLSAVTTLRIEVGKSPTDVVMFSLDTLRAILMLPNLENLSMFDTMCDSDIPLEDIPLIPMERLRHLRLSDNDPVFKLLRIVRAPLLESIIVQRASLLVENDDHSQLQYAPVYSFPSLTSLVLVDSTCDILWSLQRFMEMTSAARHITIIHGVSNVNDGILGKMRYHSPEHPIWPHLQTLVVDFRETLEIKHRLAVFLKSHQHRDGDLTLRISDTRAKAWKEVGHFQTLYAAAAELCTIEEVPEKELYDPKPWPPGGDGVRGRRVDLEADPFSTNSKLGEFLLGP